MRFSSGGGDTADGRDGLGATATLAVHVKEPHTVISSEVMHAEALMRSENRPRMCAGTVLSAIACETPPLRTTLADYSCVAGRSLQAYNCSEFSAFQ
jgi:hypothetical protein